MDSAVKIALRTVMPTHPPISLGQLIKNVEDQRGRLIRCHTMPGDTSDSTPFAMYVPSNDFDHIFVRPDVLGHHRIHVICHEIGHIFLDHRTRSLTELVLPDLNPDIVGKILKREMYDNADEREAEEFASALSPTVRETVESSTPAPGPLGDRMNQAFGG